MQIVLIAKCKGLLPKSSKSQKAGRVTPCAPYLPQKDGDFRASASGCGAHGVTRPTLDPFM